MADSPKCLTFGSLTLSPTLEQRICANLIQRWDAVRLEQGWLSPGQYRPKSYLHERFTASRMYEFDFSHRITNEGAFSIENLTLNITKDFIDQHSNRAEQDLLGGDQWFAVKPEGAEDQDPALKLFERYLQRRAELTGMRDILKVGGIKGSLIRGDTIYKCTDKVQIIRDTRNVRVVLSGGVDPVKDSRGEFVTELDKWGSDPSDPSKQILLRDPLVSMAANDASGQPLQPLLSTFTMPVVVQSNPTRGCAFALPYFADVGFCTTDPDLRQSDFVGHIFSMAPDDLMDMLPPAQRTPAFNTYFEMILNGGSPNTQLSDEATANLRRGEQDTTRSADDLAFAPRRYVEIWARVDIKEPGSPATSRRREDIMMLIDYDLGYPIAYDYRFAVAPWIKDRRNPFGIIRVNPLEKRAIGMGYYRELDDPATFVDKQFNRKSIAIATSGNLLYEDKTATTSRSAGKPLRFRSTDLHALNTGRTGEEAMHVVTIPCEIKEISEAQDEMLNRLQAMKGIVTPATAGDSGFAAADTLGGMQILEKTSDVGVKQVEAHLMGGDTEGITAAIRDFVDVETMFYDPLAASLIFQSLASAQDQAAADQQSAAAANPGAPVPPLDPAMVPVDNVAVLGAWIARNPDNIRNRVHVVLSPKNGSQIVAEAQQRIQAVTQWLTLGAQFGPEGQKMAKDEFAQILSQLGSTNPEKTLQISTPPPPPTLDANGQPTTTPGPGPTGAPVVTPPPRPMPPPQTGP
jgi:hypothetical protein